MSNLDLFKNIDYISYLKSAFGEKDKRTGLKSTFASYIDCDNSFVSKIISRNTHLSLEQAKKAASFFGLNKTEEHFFMLLVQYARAGTVELKQYFVEQINSIQKEQLLLHNHLEQVEELSELEKGIYYSSWYILAIHIAVSIEQINTKTALSEHLRVPINKVIKAVNFLLRTGLIVERTNGYTTGIMNIHLKNTSPNIYKHHINWRQRAIFSLERECEKDMHYSGVFTLSEKTAKQIKKELMSLLKKLHTDISKSKSERLTCLNMDFFSISEL